MAQILQGAGGTPVLDEDMLEKMRASGKAYAVEGEDPRIIQAGSVGNATIPMAQYITGTGPEIDLGYTYEPYIPEDKIADLMAKQKEEAEGDADDYSDLVTPSGTPMPGHPDYEAYMIAGGEGAPDSQASDGLSSSYTSFTDMFDGGGPGKAGVNFEGGLYSGALNALGVQPYGYEETAATNFESKGMGSGDAGGGGTGGGSSGNAPSGELSFGVDGFQMNTGGYIKKYGYGGPVAEQEDPYAAMPVAKPAPMAPLQGALAANQVNSQYQKPWYQQMGQDAGTAVMSNILMKGASMLIPGLGLNKGGKVCSCGTPGCPGCGKGYNHGGPISAGGYKQKIAMAESAAKIKREDMKAFADVYKKMKGPLQQGE